MKTIFLLIKSFLYSDIRFNALEKFNEYVEKYESMSTEKIEEIIEGLIKKRIEWSPDQLVIESSSFRDSGVSSFLPDSHSVIVSALWTERIDMKRKQKNSHYLLIDWRYGGANIKKKKVVYKITYSKKIQVVCTM